MSFLLRGSATTIVGVNTAGADFVVSAATVVTALDFSFLINNAPDGGGGDIVGSDFVKATATAVADGGGGGGGRAADVAVEFDGGAVTITELGACVAGGAEATGCGRGGCTGGGCEVPGACVVGRTVEAGCKLRGGGCILDDG